MKAVLGVVMIVMALTLAIAPAFTDCQSHGGMMKTADGRSVSMKCHWAGVAEVAAAIPLGIAGIYTLFGKRKETLRLASIFGVGAAAAAILLPTLLIGTCANPMMACNTLMKPIVLASGILGMAASIGVFIVAREPEPLAAPAVAA
jgi:hypothetical protein